MRSLRAGEFRAISCNRLCNMSVVALLWAERTSALQGRYRVLRLLHTCTYVHVHVHARMYCTCMRESLSAAAGYDIA